MKQLADVRAEVDQFSAIERQLKDADETLAILGDEEAAHDERTV